MTQASALAPAMSGRQVILCADDFGMSAGVSRGILELAERNRISATSAMVTVDRWPQDARRLAGVRSNVGIGLHINLTLGKPLGPMPSLAPDGEFPTLSALIGRALARRLDAGEISLEVTRQLSRFEAETGFAPDHVDGHQHVHALPGVRHAVLAALATR
ncbi:MAG: ChbG/HpnK family deacetylase, partial [Bacteroidota bacterium]